MEKTIEKAVPVTILTRMARWTEDDGCCSPECDFLKPYGLYAADYKCMLLSPNGTILSNDHEDGDYTPLRKCQEFFDKKTFD